MNEVMGMQTPTILFWDYFFHPCQISLQGDFLQLLVQSSNFNWRCIIIVTSRYWRWLIFKCIFVSSVNACLKLRESFRNQFWEKTNNDLVGNFDFIGRKILHLGNFIGVPEKVFFRKLNVFHSENIDSSVVECQCVVTFCGMKNATFGFSLLNSVTWIEGIFYPII